MSRGNRLAYLFEVKAIQKFVTAGGKLIDMAGGSAIVAGAVRSDGEDLLGAVLDQCDLGSSLKNAKNGEFGFSRRAGGVFMLHLPAAGKEQLDEFRALWRLAFAQFAPGVEFSDAVTQNANDEAAMQAAYQSGSTLRNNSLASLLPLAGPLIQRAQRTGLPAIKVQIFEEGPEAQDLPTVRKRAVGRKRGYGWQFIPDDRREQGYKWPLYIEENDRGYKKGEPLFPFSGEDRRVGIIHADISRLGQLYADLGQAVGGLPNSVALRLELSKQIETAIKTAAQKATACLVNGSDKNVLPGRPILLGGDDLTIIVRADLAILYAETFLAELETQSAQALQKFKTQIAAEHPEAAEKLKVDVLTACAGIAFARINQPFQPLSRLAESLCAYAKKQVKAGLGSDQVIPSAIAFYRQTTSLIDMEFEDVLGREARDCHQRLLSAQPYLTGTHMAAKEDDLCKLDDLKSLKDVLTQKEISRSRPRQLRGLILQNPAMAIRDYGRWREIIEKRSKGALQSFDLALGELKVTGSGDLPVFRERRTVGGGTEKELVSPLFDALEWEALS